MPSASDERQISTPRNGNEDMGGSLPLLDRLREASTTLIVARASFDIWWLYAGSQTRPKFIAGMNEYSEFFRFDEEAHFRVAVVGLYTLFDGRSDTVTLKSLIDKVELAGNDVVQIRARLSALDVKIAAIKVLRHKLFAHRDHKLAYNTVYELAKVRPDDLRMLTDESLSILNDLAALLSFRSFEFRDYVAEDALELLKKIQPGNQ